MAISVLHRELYDIPLAASVLQMPPRTLEWWLDGGVRNNRRYGPTIREDDRVGSKTVTWGELVEARYLQGYRRDLGVKLAELRLFIQKAREDMQVPYPLAHLRPWVAEGSHVLEWAQREAGLPEELWAVWVGASGQLLLTPPADSFLQRVEFNDQEEVARFRPEGPGSPIVIDPAIRWGSATIHGIPTEAIAEQVEAGDPFEVVASDFDLDTSELAAVIAYERPPQSRRAS